MTPHPKIIFFDIDETLYINRGKKYVPESAKTALKLLKQKGIITAIATGRTIPIIPPKIVELIEECGIDMIVSLNGQYVEYQGKALAAFPLDNALVAHVSGCLTAHGIAHILAAREGLFAIAENHYLHDALNALGIRYQSDPAACGKYATYQMLAFYPAAQDAEVAALLPPSLQTIRWHASGVDILDAAGSKARGIAAVLDKLDVAMIKAVGFGVAMGNAAPELKAVADYVCPSIDEDGIYRGLVDLGVIEAA